MLQRLHQQHPLADWDNNGNLLSDGVNEYDSANRLTSISGGTSATFTYNGLGDRLSQNGVNYTLDLNTGLTQVLNDGTNSYIYGVGRIAQVNAGTEYFLGDALGSVRQLANSTGEITYARAYDPYGVVTSTTGSSQSAFGFTGESYGNYNELLYLRARYYASGDGRFISRDTWGGDYNKPLSLNKWMYVEGNPINSRDPLGLCVNCYIYYFPGVGNTGDQNGNGVIEDIDSAVYEIGYGEKRLIDDLRKRTGAKVEVIFPYGPGLSGQYDMYQVMESLAYNTSNIPSYKAEEIIARILGFPIGSCYDHNFDDASLNITFIGYSGGGQAAYSTAQALTGRLFVDNLVTFGSPVRPYNGLTNIGRFLWFMSMQDNYMMEGQGFLLNAWWSTEFSEVYNSDKTTVCRLFGNDQTPYIHYDNGETDYLGQSAIDNGRDCVGEFYWKSRSSDQASQDHVSRYEANLEWLIQIVEEMLR